MIFFRIQKHLRNLKILNCNKSIAFQRKPILSEQKKIILLIANKKTESNVTYSYSPEGRMILMDFGENLPLLLN